MYKSNDAKCIWKRRTLQIYNMVFFVCSLPIWVWYVLYTFLLHEQGCKMYLQRGVNLAGGYDKSNYYLISVTKLSLKHHFPTFISFNIFPGKKPFPNNSRHKQQKNFSSLNSPWLYSLPLSPPKYHLFVKSFIFHILRMMQVDLLGSCKVILLKLHIMLFFSQKNQCKKTCSVTSINGQCIQNK